MKNAQMHVLMQYIKKSHSVQYVTLTFGLLLQPDKFTHACKSSAVIGLCSVLLPFQHSIGYMGEFLQVKRPNQQYQSTEGDSTKESTNNAENIIHTEMRNSTR